MLAIGAGIHPLNAITTTAIRIRIELKLRYCPFERTVVARAAQRETPLRRTSPAFNTCAFSHDCVKHPSLEREENVTKVPLLRRDGAFQGVTRRNKEEEQTHVTRPPST